MRSTNRTCKVSTIPRERLPGAGKDIDLQWIKSREEQDPKLATMYSNGLPGLEESASRLQTITLPRNAMSSTSLLSFTSKWARNFWALPRYLLKAPTPVLQRRSANDPSTTVGDLVAIIERDGGVIVEDLIPPSLISQIKSDLAPHFNTDKIDKSGFFPRTTQRATARNLRCLRGTRPEPSVQRQR